MNSRYLNQQDQVVDGPPYTLKFNAWGVLLWTRPARNSYTRCLPPIDLQPEQRDVDTWT